MSDVHPALIQALLDPSRYPHPVERVELLETHISWVLLAGEFAYKIKKPVNLGFVDFSTLALREKFCREELWLNRRLAPHLYLDVVAIGGEPEAPQIGDDSPPIEFAVKMRQFPQEEVLATILKRGELTTQHIATLAREVAEFHARIDVAPAGSNWGTPKHVISPVRENFEQIASAGIKALEHEALASIRDWSEQEFGRLSKLIEQRRAEGMIRECHGDLHLGNILREGDRITPFDCLEFNESLRWVDIQSEIAFLCMDLADRGRSDLAHRALNTWLEWTGDYAGLSLHRFYFVYRALVRAKVAVLRLKQSGVSAEEQKKLKVEFEGYLKLAQDSTTKRQPVLLVTHGLSGSGKTHGTDALVEQLGAIRLRSDVERKRLAGLAATDSSQSNLSAGLYGAEQTRSTYRRLEELATPLLQDGFAVIIDATNLRQETRDQFRRLAQRLDVPRLLVSFTAPVEVLRQRIQARQKSADASEATLSVLEEQLKTQEPLDPSETADAIVVDTSLETGVDRIVQRVRRISSDHRKS